MIHPVCPLVAINYFQNRIFNSFPSSLILFFVFIFIFYYYSIFSFVSLVCQPPPFFSFSGMGWLGRLMFSFYSILIFRLGLDDVMTTAKMTNQVRVFLFCRVLLIYFPYRFLGPKTNQWVVVLWFWAKGNILP